MPRFITCLTSCAPTLRKGANKDNPAEYATKVPIKNLELVIESQSDDPVPGTKRVPKRDVEPGGGLHVEFVDGKFSMPYPFIQTNDDALKLEAELKKCNPPRTIPQAQRIYKFLVDNESGLLGVSYQFDPSDLHWTNVDPRFKQPDGKSKSTEEIHEEKINKDAKLALKRAEKSEIKEK